MPKKLRPLYALLRGQMTDWLYSPRTIMMGLVILSLGFINAKSFQKAVIDYALTSHFGEAMYTYLSTGFGNLLMISVYFLVMVSEIPRRIPAQLTMLIRTNRMKWLKSQILFCFIIVILMIALLTLLSMVLTLPYVTPGSGWSMRSSNLELNYIPDYVPDYIRVMTPFQANALAISVLFAFWFTMVLVILLFSLAGKPNVGLIIYVSILMVAVTLMWEYLPPWFKTIIPTNYATLSNIGVTFPNRELKSVPIVLLSYAIADVMLIGGMVIIVRNMDLHFIKKG